MADGKIYIIVTDKLPQSTQAGVAAFPSEPKQEANKQNNRTWGYVEHRVANFAEQQALKAVNYTLSNIGNFTGDYQAQRDVNAGLTVIHNLMNIGMATLAGAKFGPVGAAVGAGLAVSSIAINFAYEQKSLEIQQKKSNHQINILKQRSGLNTLRDGSRGTEN